MTTSRLKILYADQLANAIIAAVKKGHEETVNKLLDIIKNLDTSYIKQSSLGKALYFCTDKNDFLLAEKIILAGANINIQREDGNTPLHEACAKFRSELIEFLLAHGANPFLRNANDKMPIDLAIDKLEYNSQLKIIQDYFLSFENFRTLHEARVKCLILNQGHSENQPESLIRRIPTETLQQIQKITFGGVIKPEAELAYFERFRKSKTAKRSYAEVTKEKVQEEPLKKRVCK